MSLRFKRESMFQSPSWLKSASGGSLGLTEQMAWKTLSHYWYQKHKTKSGLQIRWLRENRTKWILRKHVPHCFPEEKQNMEVDATIVHEHLECQITSILGIISKRNAGRRCHTLGIKTERYSFMVTVSALWLQNSRYHRYRIGRLELELFRPCHVHRRLRWRGPRIEGTSRYAPLYFILQFCWVQNGFVFLDDSPAFDCTSLNATLVGNWQKERNIFLSSLCLKT